jgi:hypothetical protein
MGCVLDNISFRGGLALDLRGNNQLLISGRLDLTVPARGEWPEEVLTIDPYATSRWERPLFDFAGSTCEGVVWDGNGQLHMKFSSGHRIDVSADEHIPAWELFAEDQGYATCLPRGQVKYIELDPATVEIMKKRRSRGAPPSTGPFS